MIQSKFAEPLKIPITEPLEPEELRISALAYPQMDPLKTQKLHGFLDARVLSLWSPLLQRIKIKTPWAIWRCFFP